MSKDGRRGNCKSPSQELREVFMKLYAKDAEGFKEFDEYYNSKMKKIILHYKKMLDK